MTAVADSSPLWRSLAVLTYSIGFSGTFIFPAKFEYEVVVAGAGLPGASEVSEARWIEVRAVENQAALRAAQRQYGLGLGEMSAIVLAKEVDASAVLLDDYRARELAKAEGLGVLGSVGLLETLYLRNYLTDLPGVFQQLLAHDVYIDKRLLDRRLRALGLPTL